MPDIKEMSPASGRLLKEDNTTINQADILADAYDAVAKAFKTAPIGNNLQVGSDLTATWADSAAANTAVNVDVALPTSLQGSAKYLVEIYNPSAVTALTVIAQNKALSFGGATRYPELTRWSVAASGVKAVIVEGWLLDAAGRLVLSNDTALGAGQGFTASIRVIKI
jgi:hypothetical protein